MSRYLDPSDFKGKSMSLTISAIKREIVNGRPQLVVYFENQEKGLVLTRRLKDELTAALGHSRMVEEFFAGEGNLQ